MDENACDVVYDTDLLESDKEAGPIQSKHPPYIPCLAIHPFLDTPVQIPTILYRCFKQLHGFTASYWRSHSSHHLPYLHPHTELLHTERLAYRVKGRGLLHMHREDNI